MNLFFVHALANRVFSRFYNIVLHILSSLFSFSPVEPNDAFVECLCNCLFARHGTPVYPQHCVTFWEGGYGGGSKERDEKQRRDHDDTMGSRVLYSLSPRSGRRRMSYRKLSK